MSLSVMAQSVPDILPGSADPGRAITNNSASQLEFGKVKRKLRPKSVQSDIPQDAAQIQFVLKEIKAQGMTAYAPTLLQKYAKPYLNKKISKATIFEIAAKLQQKYLRDGYTITKVIVPEQNFKSGVIKILVIEGYVAEVDVNKDIRKSSVIDDAVRRMRAMKPLNTKKLERLMLILNSLSGLKTAAVLATPQGTYTTPGAIRLILENVPVERAGGIINLNNYGSIFSGPVQATVSGNVSHAGLNYSNLSLTATAAAPIREMRYASLAYEFPVFGASGAKLDFSGVIARTQPGDSLKELEIRGTTHEFGTRLSYPVVLQRDKSWLVDAAFRVQNAKTNIVGERLYDDRIRKVLLGTQVSYADGFLGINALDFSLHQGLDVLNNRKSGSIDLSREDGRSDFTKFTGSVGRRQALPKNFELYGVVQGQYTNDPLLSAEEFGFGGAGLGRGYDPSEITGDRGIAGTLELRYSKPVDRYDAILQPYVFYDMGKVWNIDPGAKNHVSAVSAGVGIRMNWKESWAVDSSVSVPLTREVDNPPSYSKSEGIRALFSVTRRF